MFGRFMAEAWQCVLATFLAVEIALRYQADQDLLNARERIAIICVFLRVTENRAERQRAMQT